MTDSTNANRRHRARRRRLAPVAVVAGVLASAALAASLTGALGAFTAKIFNDTNTAATGNLTMQETGSGAIGAGTTGTAATCTSNDGSTATSVSTNSATCSTINKYGGSTIMVPGTPVITTVTLKNTGTVKANGFTLTPSACTPLTSQTVHGTATDMCSKMTVSVTEQRFDNTGTALGAATSVVPTSTLTAFFTASGTAGVTLAPVPAGYYSTYTFTVTLPSQGASPADNAYQGLAVSQPLAWQFTS